MTAMLDVKKLEVAYGGIKAIKGIDFHVDEGELVTLIGANGAGKSSTLRALSGLIKPAAGQRARHLQRALFEARNHFVDFVDLLQYLRVIVPRIRAHEQVLVHVKAREHAPAFGAQRDTKANQCV